MNYLKGIHMLYSCHNGQVVSLPHIMHNQDIFSFHHCQQHPFLQNCTSLQSKITRYKNAISGGLPRKHLELAYLSNFTKSIF